jgi:hypothetical protein
MSEKNYSFQKLTPTSNVELRVYEDALNFIFANNDIKNVAVSGSYSAGKSSVIETYKSIHTDIRFLHISLAHFESPELGNSISTNRIKVTSQEKNLNQNSHSKSPKSNDEGSEKGIETILEGKILNQLIHQIDPDKIPQTNFKVKQKVSSGKIILNTVIITIFLILVAYIGFFNDWYNFVSTLTLEWLKTRLMWTTNNVYLILSGLLCTIIFGIATYSIIKTQKNRNIFRKVSLQGNEIEIFEENDDSYFDKYLNEVLYLFENSNADAIVFEDMDRYNVNEIFEKLREVNTLINYKKNKEKKKTIRFFYLLRDDIFISKDRTKFFDFIVPIVPVIDGSNSYDQFIEHFKQAGIFKLFDENFLQGLSLYVDDMRILKNIYNEFIIYHNRIQSTELSNNKLLAIIVYKNIFPRDFSDLQLGMGFVNTLFESKPNFIKQVIQKIENKIHDCENRILQTNDELLKNIDELDAVFLKVGKYGLYVSGQLDSEFETRAKFIRAMKDNPSLVQYYNYNYGLQPFDIQSKFNELQQDPIYTKRKDAIERKSAGSIENLKFEIHKLQKQKSIVQNSRIRELITKENIDTIFSVIFTNEIGQENKFEEIKASPYFPLIKYLLRNGYIDETYPDYMTYFYENSLSRIDKIFLRSVTDEASKEYNYSLKNPELVLSRLRAVDFYHEEILNFDLLCYLLKTKQSNASYIALFLQQLKETKNFSFISQFLDTRRETNLFLESLNRFWSSGWKCILDESDFSAAQKKQYAIDTLYFSPNADIVALNQNSCLTAFISSNPNFLDIDNPSINKIIDGFALLDVRFAWIDFSRSNKELFNAVYTNSLYQLTFALISLMLEMAYNMVKSNDFKSKSYTLISSKPNEPLALYVNDNINEYIRIVLENCDKFINDEESAVLAILNNTEVDTDSKEKYISFLQTVIEHIEKVSNKELWSLLLQQKHIKYSEDNILNYFFQSEKGLDSYLVQFINTNSDDLSFNYESINNKFGENTASKFYIAIITCNQLSNNKYETILVIFNRYYNSFTYKEIDGDKITILIKVGIIRMTSENLSFMRENYPDHIVSFIVKSISQYTNDIINKENFDFDEMLLILDQNVVDEYKIKLLQHTADEVSIQQKKYSDIVKKHILEYNLDVTDIQFLLKAFPKESGGIKEVIRQIAIEHITEIITQEYLIPFELLTELLLVKEISTETKKELFALCLPNMNVVFVKKYLKVLQMNDFLSLLDRKRPKFEINPINKQILDTFKEKNWIYTYEVDKDDSDYYRAFGRKMAEE